MKKYLPLANDQKINQHNHSGLDQFSNLTNSSHSQIFSWVRRGQLRTCALLSITSNLQAGHLPCRCSCQVSYTDIGLLIIPSWFDLLYLGHGNIDRSGNSRGGDSPLNLATKCIRKKLRESWLPPVAALTVHRP